MSTLELTDDLTITVAIPYETGGTNDRTHIVNPPANTHIWRPGMTSQDIVDIARVTQQNVKTLCGKVFTPKQDPERFEACEECMRIAGDIMREMG